MKVNDIRDNGILRRDRHRVLRQVEFLLAQFRPRPSDRLVDLGCGEAPHLLHLAARGYTDLVGIDVDRPALQAAAERASKTDARITLRCGDFADLRFRCVLAYSFFGAFGHGAERDVVRDLRRLAARVEPGGALVVDLVNRDFFVATPTLERWSYDGTTAILESARLDDLTGVLHTRRKYTGPRGEKDFVWTQRAFSPAEITDLLRASGFQRVDCAAGERGEAPSRSRQRLLAWGYR